MEMCQQYNCSFQEGNFKYFYNIPVYMDGTGLQDKHTTQGEKRGQNFTVRNKTKTKLASFLEYGENINYSEQHLLHGHAVEL